MKIDNRTRYPTRLLRSVLCAVHNGQSRKLPRWPNVTVQVRYARKGDSIYSGHAYLNGYFSCLSVPRGGLNVLEFAALWDHELAHLFGINHKDMAPSVLRAKVTDRIRGMVSKIPEAIPDPSETKSTPTPIGDLRQKRIANLVKRRAVWITKRKRTETAIAKIDRSLNYYRNSGAFVPALEPKAARRRRRRARK